MSYERETEKYPEMLPRELERLRFAWEDLMRRYAAGAAEGYAITFGEYAAPYVAEMMDRWVYGVEEL